jgi:hypothetical protein
MFTSLCWGIQSDPNQSIDPQTPTAIVMRGVMNWEDYAYHVTIAMTDI